MRGKSLCLPGVSFVSQDIPAPLPHPSDPTDPTDSSDTSNPSSYSSAIHICTCTITIMITSVYKLYSVLQLKQGCFMSLL